MLLFPLPAQLDLDDPQSEWSFGRASRIASSIRMDVSLLCWLHWLDINKN